MIPYIPEGVNASTPGVDDLRRGMGNGEIFQAMCVKCDEFHNLHLQLRDTRAIIPREEAALGIREGNVKEMAILSRVGKWVSFQALGFDSRGTAILSRRSAQAEAKKTLAEAEYRAEQLVSTSEIFKKSEQAAQEMIDKANKKCAQLYAVTKENVDKMLRSVEMYLDQNLNVVRRNRDELDKTIRNIYMVALDDDEE